MNDEAIVAALAEAMYASMSLNYDNLAPALLPVVRRVAVQRAAEELLAAASEVAEGHQGDKPDWNRRTVPAWLRDRAAALTATPNHGRNAT